MIGGLQGEFGDLDNKYLKKNISKCRSHISGSFRRTPRHCAKWLWNSPGKRYQRIRTCLTGEVETPSSPIRRHVPNVKYPEKVERRSDKNLLRVEWAMSRLMLGGWFACARCRDPSPWWHGEYPEQLHPDSLREHVARSPIRTPSGRSTRHSWASHLGR